MALITAKSMAGHWLSALRQCSGNTSFWASFWIDTFFKHSQQHVHTRRSNPVAERCGIPYAAVLTNACTSIRKGVPSTALGDGDTAHAFVVLGSNSSEGLPPAVVRPAHFVDSQFSRTTESVLDAAQDAVHVVLVSFELQYGIDDVFQYLRSGDASFLVDMSDEDNRVPVSLANLKREAGTFSYLHDAAGRRITFR